MSISLIQSQLKIIESRGVGSLVPDIVFIDEWSNVQSPTYEIDSLAEINHSSYLFHKYLLRSEIDCSRIYFTWAEKGWMYSEDEWHESLKKELELLKPKIVVALGDRKVPKMLLKIKDMMRDFAWFHKIHSPCVVNRFYDDDSFYLDELNFLARDYQNGEIVALNKSFR